MFPTITLFHRAVDSYGFFNNLGILALLLCNFLQLKTRRDSLGSFSKRALRRFGSQKRFQGSLRTKPMFYAVIETLVVFVIEGSLALAFNRLWAIISTNTYANYFGIIFFLPPALLLALAVFNFPALRQLDLAVPGFAANLICAKTACFFHGCCYGVPMEHSFYWSVYRERGEFPVQLLEALVAAALLIVMCAYLKRNTREGSAFPVFVVLYSATRFVTEFWRGDFPVLSIGLKLYQLQCLAGVLLGVAEYFLVTRLAGRSLGLREGFAEAARANSRRR